MIPSATSRRAFLKMLGAGAAAAAWPGLLMAGGEKASRPNIVFIFSDDHAIQTIGAYGSKINKTPNIDRLASGGMLFSNCLCANSLCEPSRATILTGKHSHLNGMFTNGLVFDGSQQTFPKLLQKAGYQTSLVGKWHLESDPTGFDHWEVLTDLDGQGLYYNTHFKSPQGKVRRMGYVTDVITDRSIQWLKEERKPDAPFVLMCQHKGVHTPYMASLKNLDLYENEQIPEPADMLEERKGWKKPTAENYCNGWPSYELKLPPTAGTEDAVWWGRVYETLGDSEKAKWQQTYGPRNEAFAKANYTPEQAMHARYQRWIKEYLRTVASLDDGIGRLLDYLDSSGLAKDTIVIYSSDQGYFIGEYGMFGKGFMYEPSFHMPLIVRWPGVTKAGSVSKELVQNLDFAETLLDLAGAPRPADMQGESFVPLLRGQAVEWRKSVYYGDMTQQGVRTKQYTLVHFFKEDRWELYDVLADVEEKHNLYGLAQYAKVQAELRAELDRLKKLYKVPEKPFEDLTGLMAGGTVIGRWKAAEVGDEFRTLSWDASGCVDGPGEYLLEFKYTSGEARLQVLGAEMVSEGEVIARDGHCASTGLIDFANVYRLKVEKVKGGAKVTVRADCRAPASFASNGTVRIKKMSK